MRASKLGRYSWTMFDWANQPFYTLIMTFVFSVYFTTEFITSGDGEQKLFITQIISGLTIALLSPILGSITDIKGNRKLLMGITSALFVLGMALLWYSPPGAPDGIWLVMAGLILASTMVGFAEVFNNSLLSSIETPENSGWLSGMGYGVGYISGLIALLIFYFILVLPGDEVDTLYGFNTNQYEHIRIVGPLCAIWYAVFIIPLFLFTPDTKKTQIKVIDSIKIGWNNFRNTFKEVRKYKNIFIFLVTRLFYQDALNYLFVVGGVYAATVVGMSINQVLVLGIILNIFSGPSAIYGGYLNDWIGSKNVINISLWGLLISGTLGLSIDKDTIFYFFTVNEYSANIEEMTFGIFNSVSQVTYICVVIGIALFYGPAQTASRALMIKISPPEKMTEFFGLYAFSGKSTAWLLPVITTIVITITGSLQYAMISIVLFNLIGIVGMYFVYDDSSI